MRQQSPNARLRWTSLSIALALGWASAFGLSVPARALTAPAELDALEETDRDALERLASQPAPLREAALRATQYVDVLVETQRIQEQSSADFQERIAELDRETQEQLWEIVRQPGLLEELIGSGPRSSPQLEAIAARHPEDLAPAIRALGSDQTLLLGHVLTIQRRANERFELLLRDVPDAASREAFRDLLVQPELLSLLGRRVRLAVRLGDSFRDDPDGTRAQLAALGEEVAANDARSRDAWVQSIAEDPEAAAELEESARAYADENGYDYDELTEPDVRTRVEIVVHPYPYWFGYPYWYADAYLFPYGYWWHYPPHFGFYHHRHHRRFVWFGFPSVHFAYWFFGGHHHRHYTHLSHGFDRHYRRYRHSGSAFHHTVGNWVRWRDRDHRHGYAGHRRHRGDRVDRHRSGGGRGGGLFVTLFEQARFREDASPRVRDGRRFDRRRGDRDDRGDRDRRDDRAERGDRDRRDGRAERGDRDRRDGRAERGDRDRRDGRAERGDRDRRDGRAERGDRDRRDDRAERGDRDRRDDRAERGDRDRRDDRAERGDRDRRGEDAERGGRDDREDRARSDRDRGEERNDRARGRRGRGKDDRTDRVRVRVKRDDREEGRVARPDPRRERPRVNVRDSRGDDRANRGSASMERRERSSSGSARERGFSSRGRDRGPSFDRGRSGGGRQGGAAAGRGGGGGRGRGRR